MTTVENTYLSGNFAPVHTEITAVDLPVTGTIPASLEGRLLRNGPNPMGEEDPATYHWFVGTGMVHGVRLRDGKAEWYRNRSVGEGVANTNVIGHAGRTLATVEAGLSPVELGYDLDPIGPYDFDGSLEGAFTAHAKRDPLSGELHAVTYQWDWDHIRYVVIDTTGHVRRVVQIPVPDRIAVHDCAITETNVVLFDLPLVFDLDAAMNGARYPYRWKPDHQPRIGVLPRDESAGADDVRWFEIEPCFVYHPLNAYDLPDGGVVLDAVRHPSTFAKDMLGPNDGQTTLDRWTLDPASGKAREERLDDRGQEFPRHDERRLGRPYRYGYAATYLPGAQFGGILKHDLAAGTSEARDFGPDRYSLEPVFVPRSDDAAEDDGWIMAYVYDATTDRSDVVILAAQDFAGDPVATIALPQRVPFGFHGNWVPDSQ
ncbi:MAG: carotenoid cleavage oxygenase [Actinomycetota bacterium]|jgi:carotenoid cleavage dioxygenase